MTIPTIDQTVSRMKVEIMTEIQAGRIPDTVESFSELHDYVDANEFGGFCDDAIADAMIAYFGGRDADEGMPDAMLDYINDCQNAINEWLADHGHRLYKREFPDFTLDVAIPECFEDRSWHNDAMPSFVQTIGNNTLTLFVDYADPAMSEWPSVDKYKRFRLYAGTVDGMSDDYMFESNDYNAVLKMIAMWEDAQ
jgi:hypothetical protein